MPCRPPSATLPPARSSTAMAASRAQEGSFGGGLLFHVALPIGLAHDFTLQRPFKQGAVCELRDARSTRAARPFASARDGGYIPPNVASAGSIPASAAALLEGAAMPGMVLIAPWQPRHRAATVARCNFVSAGRAIPSRSTISARGGGKAVVADISGMRQGDRRPGRVAREAEASSSSPKPIPALSVHPSGQQCRNRRPPNRLEAFDARRWRSSRPNITGAFLCARAAVRRSRRCMVVPRRRNRQSEPRRRLRSALRAIQLVWAASKGRPSHVTIGLFQGWLARAFASTVGGPRPYPDRIHPPREPGPGRRLTPMVPVRPRAPPRRSKRDHHCSCLRPGPPIAVVLRVSADVNRTALLRVLHGGGFFCL